MSSRAFNGPIRFPQHVGSVHDHGRPRLGLGAAALSCSYVALTVHWAVSVRRSTTGRWPSYPGAVVGEDPHPRSSAGRPLEPWVCDHTREPTVLFRVSCRHLTWMFTLFTSFAWALRVRGFSPSSCRWPIGPLARAIRPRRPPTRHQELARPWDWCECVPEFLCRFSPEHSPEHAPSDWAMRSEWTATSAPTRTQRRRRRISRTNEEVASFPDLLVQRTEPFLPLHLATWWVPHLCWGVWAKVPLNSGACLILPTALHCAWFHVLMTLSSPDSFCILFDITSEHSAEVKWLMLNKHNRWFHSSREISLG